MEKVNLVEQIDGLISFRYVTLIHHKLLFSSLLQPGGIAVGRSHFREHLIGQEICVVQDEASIFWLVFLEEKDCAFGMHLSAPKNHFAHV